MNIYQVILFLAFFLDKEVAPISDISEVVSDTSEVISNEKTPTISIEEVKTKITPSTSDQVNIQSEAAIEYPAYDNMAKISQNISNSDLLSSSSPTFINSANSKDSIKDIGKVSSPYIISKTSYLQSEDLVWISTIEGLTAHLDLMKRFWAIASSHKRNLVVASYKSVHYPGVKSVNICQHFKLPDNVKCIEVRRNILVNDLSCTLAPQEAG
jgi:hypothetical protein